MPPLESMDMPDWVVLWEFTGRYDRQGKPIVLAPVEFKVCWDTTKRQVRRDKDNIIYVEGDLFVPRDIPEHSILILGRLDDWGTLGTGTTGAAGSLMEVVRFDKIGDIKVRNYTRTVSISRYAKKLPTVQV